jgi:hypothetical protein
MKTTVKLASGLGALAAVAGVASVAHAQTSATATSSGSATVVEPFSANKISDLAFGTIVKPTTGTATVSVDVSGSRSLTGTVAVGGGAGAAQFQVLGQGGQAYSVTVPGSFNMTAGTNTLVVTTTDNSGGGGTLSGSVGTYSTATFGVGGAINLTTGTASGAYTGSFTVTASYN